MFFSINRLMFKIIIIINITECSSKYYQYCTGTKCYSRTGTSNQFKIQKRFLLVMGDIVFFKFDTIICIFFAYKKLKITTNVAINVFVSKQ